MSDRPLTVDEARRMFEALDSAALDRQARAEKAAQTRYRVCIEPSFEAPSEGHVLRDVTLEVRCTACGHWEANDFSTSAIDFIDDDQDADRTGTYSIAEVRTWEGSYLRDVVEDLLEQAK